MPNLKLDLSKLNENKTALKLPDICSPIAQVARRNILDLELKPIQDDTHLINQRKKLSECVMDISKKFLKMQNIYPGETFGLQDILFDNQPNMQLISNGCECILIHKEFFLQNSNMDYLKLLRKVVYPFPELKEIECNYRKQMQWKNYTEKILVQTLKPKSAKPKSAKSLK